MSYFDPPYWWDESIAKMLNFPLLDQSNYYYTNIKKYKGLINGKFINCDARKFYRSKNETEFKFLPLFENNRPPKISDLYDKLDDKTDESNESDDEPSDESVEESVDQKELLSCKITHRFRVYFNKKQRHKINRYFYECKKVYDCCVRLYKKRPHLFNRINKNKYKFIKTIIFDELYGKTNVRVNGKKKNIKPAPFDMLTDEVRAFCSNLKSCCTNKSTETY